MVENEGGRRIPRGTGPRKGNNAPTPRPPRQTTSPTPATPDSEAEAETLSYQRALLAKSQTLDAGTTQKLLDTSKGEYTRRRILLDLSATFQQAVAGSVAAAAFLIGREMGLDAQTSLTAAAIALGGTSAGVAIRYWMSRRGGGGKN